MARVVVLKTGWMKRYAGIHADDQTVIGGGSYNIENLGHERFNFAPVAGRVRGFAQIGRAQAGLNVRRIDPAARSGESLRGVLVIWVAPDPRPGPQEGSSTVVGWYRDATVFPTLQPGDATRDQCGYVCSTSTDDATLLPEVARTWIWPNVLHGSATGDPVRLPDGQLRSVESGEGGFGQTLVVYTRDDSGGERDMPWLRAILARIDAYGGPNLVASSEQEEQEAAVAALASRVAGRTSAHGGFAADPAVRKAIEERAMELAETHYDGLGWQVDPTVHTSNPFDLLCRRASGEELRVEVKGTTGVGDAVLVTRREVESARQHPTDLVVVTGITVDPNGGAPIASGGRVEIESPWNPAADSLEPIGYWYSRG